MIKEEIGSVLRIEGDIAYIRPSTPEACNKCSAKKFCGGGGLSIRAKNRAGAKAGDSVIFTIDIEDLNIRFILYLVLFLVIFLVGVVFGFSMGEKIGFSKEFAGLISGFVFLIVGGFLYRVVSKKLPKKEKIPEIIKIIKEDK